MSSKESKGKKIFVKRFNKGKRQLDTNDLTNVDRTFYELTINDLNNKLSRIKSQLISSEEKNYSLSIKLQAFEEGRDDITCHLQRVLVQRDKLIGKHEDTIQILKETYKRETTKASVTMHELDMKYTDMKNGLTSEIKLLKGQLSALDEFRRLRDILYEKYDDMRAEDKKRDWEHEEKIFELQQKTVVERDSLRKEIENKLLQVSQDFTLSSEIRNAGYTHRLIRENVALQKETEQLMGAQIKIQQDFKQHLKKTQRANEEYSILKETQAQLLQSGKNKILVIEKLTGNYEHLKEKYIEVLRYRSLYENLMKKDKCESQYVRDMTVKLRVLGQSIESMKLEKSRLQSILKQQEFEADKLREIIQQIKNSIEVVIDDINDDKTTNKSETGERKTRRLNLLLHLMNIITRHSNTIPQASSLTTAICSQSSVYHKGNIGLVPPQAVSLMEIFKRCPHIKGSATTSDVLTFEILSNESIIVPRERSKDGGSIVDVKWGSSLYVSSDHEDMDLLQIEDDILAENDSTSSYQSTHAEDNNKRKTSVGTKTASAVSQHSDVSLVSNVITNKYSSDISMPSQKHRISESCSEDEEFSIELFY